MYRLSSNLGPSTSRNPLVLSKPAQGLLYLLPIEGSTHSWRTWTWDFIQVLSQLCEFSYFTPAMFRRWSCELWHHTGCMVRGLNPGKVKKFLSFTSVPYRPWGPPSLGTGVLSQGSSCRSVKLTAHPSGSEAKSEWNYVSSPPVCLQDVDRDSFGFCNFSKWPTCTIILFYNTFITALYMFRATSCSSSGGQIVLIQHLVSSLSVRGLPVPPTAT